MRTRNCRDCNVMGKNADSLGREAVCTPEKRNSRAGPFEHKRNHTTSMPDSFSRIRYQLEIKSILECKYLHIYNYNYTNMFCLCIKMCKSNSPHLNETFHILASFHITFDYAQRRNTVYSSRYSRTWTELRKKKKKKGHVQVKPLPPPLQSGTQHFWLVSSRLITKPHRQKQALLATFGLAHSLCYHKNVSDAQNLAK